MSIKSRPDSNKGDGCHSPPTVSGDITRPDQIILMGNPNVGKSVIFNHLTGAYATISNYPGTTVEITSGKASFRSDTVVIDSPGIASLVPRSEDENVARQLLLQENKKIVAQITDAKALARGLVLTLQLIETGLPLVLVLNMADEAVQKGIAINTEKLSELLGIPVISAVAVKGEGIRELIESVNFARPSTHSTRYDTEIEEASADIEKGLPVMPVAGRAIATMLLSNDKYLYDWLAGRLAPAEVQRIKATAANLQSRSASPTAYRINRTRTKEAQHLASQVIQTSRTSGHSFAERFGEWSLHPVWGIPILLFVLFAFYMVVGKLGAGIVVDFVKTVLFDRYINPAAIWLFSLVPIPLFQDLMVGQFGIVTMAITYAVAIILPVVGFFFIFFSILEDLGYLPRLAVMSDVALKRIGLSGKAILPMVLGLGCGTMAILTTRILESKRERVLCTLLMAMAIPCSAQLGIILALLSGIPGAGTLIFTGILLSQLILIGLLASKLLPGNTPPFALEVPPIRLPQPGNIAKKTLLRLESYFKEAVPLFILGTLVLFILNRTGLLGIIQRGGAPVVRDWLGLPVETTGPFIFGFLRRDYGAAGFFQLQQQGLLNPNQVVISLVVLTLFLPCIAQFFVMIKERGLWTSLAIAGFLLPFSVLIGGLLNLVLKILGVSL